MNTTRKIILTLEEVYELNGEPTGVTKPNTIGDPDYIAPYIDPEHCAVEFSYSCPLVKQTVLPASVEFEFSLPAAVLNNPDVSKVDVRLMYGAALVSQQIFNLPHGPYFTGVLPNSGANDPIIEIYYLDSGDNVLASCGQSGLLINGTDFYLINDNDIIQI